jgi:hypothetical protein
MTPATATTMVSQHHLIITVTIPRIARKAAASRDRPDAILPAHCQSLRYRRTSPSRVVYLVTTITTHVTTFVNSNNTPAANPKSSTSTASVVVIISNNINNNNKWLLIRTTLCVRFDQGFIVYCRIRLHHIIAIPK